MLSRIVDVLPCNADYLLGFEDKPTYSEAYISEQTGLSDQAVSKLIRFHDELCQLYDENTYLKMKPYMITIARLASEFILSDQFVEILSMAIGSAMFQVEKEIEQLKDNLARSKNEDILTDRAEKTIASIYSITNKATSPGMKYDLMISAAKQQAMEKFGNFFESFVSSQNEAVRFERKANGEH
ncbi:hypothetical protein SDC9_135006 [bioreactor metagenome]|uniref:Uncharacterized protein n=1 Tax=bioreactor metagenome TaxID=1076179 RepID=A0A645DFB1_9ZZZZ